MSYAELIEMVQRPVDVAVREHVIAQLHRAGPSARADLIAGLSHPAWRVRHLVLRILDHHLVDDDLRVRVVAALSDPHKKVRKAALHLLACERCKPEGYCGIPGVDIEGEQLRLAEHDPSATVRRAALWAFMLPGVAHAGRVSAALRRMAAADPDHVVRARAAYALELGRTAAIGA